MATDPSPRRVRAVAQDTPDRFDDVDTQLLRDYPELAERIRQEREGGR